MCCIQLAGNAGPTKSPKIRHLATIAQICRTISSQLRHISTIGKKLLSSNTLYTCPRNMVNFGPLTAEIGSGVWGTPANFIGFCVLACSITARHSSSRRQPNFAVLNRGRHLYWAGRPSRWALAHILVHCTVANVTSRTLLQSPYLRTTHVVSSKRLAVCACMSVPVGV